MSQPEVDASRGAVQCIEHKGLHVRGRVPKHLKSPARASSASETLGRQNKKMAKTYKNIFPKIFDFEALHQAHLRARLGKRYRAEVLRFSQRLEENLIQLQNELIWKTYRTGEYRTFYVHEPKRRLVAALPYRDRIVQHSLVAQIEPIWEKLFIFDSYACRIHKGTHSGADRAQEFLRENARRNKKTVCLKGDISQYFPNIDHQILKTLLRKRIACENTLWLCDEIIESSGKCSCTVGKGVPIGNLTSQLFANVYLHELDVFVKYALREPSYMRYMDDFLIVGNDKTHMHKLRRQISEFLDTQLRLKLNAKTQVFDIEHRGVDFLGYRIWPTHRLIRKNSIRRMRRKLKAMTAKYIAGEIEKKKIDETVRSWAAHAMHADTYRLRSKIFGQISLPVSGMAESEAS
jgi:RNA-directed DNA polymerase